MIVLSLAGGGMSIARASIVWFSQVLKEGSCEGSWTQHELGWRWKEVSEE